MTIPLLRIGYKVVREKSYRFSAKASSIANLIIQAKIWWLSNLTWWVWNPRIWLRGSNPTPRAILWGSCFDVTRDNHGNMTSIPQLRIMQWDYKDQLCMTQRQKVNDEDEDGIKRQGERTY